MGVNARVGMGGEGREGSGTEGLPVKRLLQYIRAYAGNRKVCTVCSLLEAVEAVARLFQLTTKEA